MSRAPFKKASLHFMKHYFPLVDKEGSIVSTYNYKAYMKTLRKHYPELFVKNRDMYVLKWPMVGIASMPDIPKYFKEMQDYDKIKHILEGSPTLRYIFKNGISTKNELKFYETK